ncbi:MAG TPA: type II toxin-antitoxin system VapC family toxin [Candidatus Methylomirabilis sp.]|nr:type II toxin-antitoxin system VapC family toxin [Candidatus Methylomirabilis sp.]
MPGAWAYFDTSAVVKRYIREPGSQRLRALLRRYRVLSSAVMPVEAVSAFSRRHASGELTARDFQAIIARLEKDRAHWDLVEVTSEVLSRAEDLVRRTSLRALDAVHVASVLTVERAAGLRFAFVTADAVQRDAAAGLSLELVWLE